MLPVSSGGLSLFIRHRIATMKSLADIIREQLLEDAFIRSHEAKIIAYYSKRTGLAGRKPPSSVPCSSEAALIMNETGTSS